MFLFQWLHPFLSRRIRRRLEVYCRPERRRVERRRIDPVCAACWFHQPMVTR